jgi:hypothetical protein
MPTALLLVPLILAVGVVVAATMLAKRVGGLVPFAFIMTYVFGVGALLLVNIGVFGIVDPKFHASWASAWLEIFWPLWTTFFAPSIISALFASRFSGLSTRRDAVRLLGLFLFLILFAIQIAWVIDAGPVYLVSVFAILSAIFFAKAGWKRGANSAHSESSVLGGTSRQ